MVTMFAIFYPLKLSGTMYVFDDFGLPLGEGNPDLYSRACFFGEILLERACKVGQTEGVGTYRDVFNLCFTVHMSHYVPTFIMTPDELTWGSCISETWHILMLKLTLPPLLYLVISLYHGTLVIYTFF